MPLTQTAESATPERDTAKLLVKLMDRLHGPEIFATPEKSKEFLDSISFEEFRKWTDLVNGIARELPVPERGIGSSNSYIDEESDSDRPAQSVVYFPPLPRQREALLREAFEQAQSIEDPAMAGLTLGFAFNAIHPYEDGNGRTSRIVFALLSQGYDGSPEKAAYYSDLLQNVSGRDVISANPELHGVDMMVERDLYETIAEKSHYSKPPQTINGGHGDKIVGGLEAHDIPLSEDVSDKARRQLHYILQDEGFNKIALMIAFPEERVAPYMKTSPGGMYYLDGDAFVATLSDEDISIFMMADSRTKDAFVKMLISFADRPDAQTILDQYMTQTPEPERS